MWRKKKKNGDEYGKFDSKFLIKTLWVLFEQYIQNWHGDSGGIECSFHFQLNFNNCKLKCRLCFLFAYENSSCMCHSIHDDLLCVIFFLPFSMRIFFALLSLPFNELHSFVLRPPFPTHIHAHFTVSFNLFYRIFPTNNRMNEWMNAGVCWNFLYAMNLCKYKI